MTSNSSGRALRALLLSAAGALALAACATGPTPQQQHDAQWAMAARSDVPDGYQTYLRLYPDGPNAEAARR
jgi:ABC-type uncharacterized transport system auxiliary subunit